MEFDITDRCSGALRGILYDRGWAKRKTFSLEIAEGPLLSYVLSLPTIFRRDFHVGCSDDRRPPSFNMEARDNGLYLTYSRTLTWQSKNMFARDKKEHRDLEVVSKEFSNPQVYSERFGLIHEFEEKGIVHNCKIFLRFLNNMWLYLEGADEFYEEERLKNLSKGTIFDFDNGPYKGNEILKENFIEAYKLANIGISVGDVTAVFEKIFGLNQIDGGLKKKHLGDIGIIEEKYFEGTFNKIL